MMRISQILACGVATLGVVLSLAGCGGGGSGFSFSRFVGSYSGSFSGTTLTGAPVRGTFTANVGSDGQLDAEITQNGTTFPATGTVTVEGNVIVTATGGVAGQPSAFTSTLTGILRPDGEDIIGTGTLTTTQGGVANAVTGRWSAIRARPTANPFQGTYNGSFVGTGTSAGLTGTFAVTTDANGALTGLVNQAGLGTYNASGTMARNGQITVFAVGAVPGNPPQQFVSTLSGTATANGAAVTASGTFQTVQGGQTAGSGNFTATRSTPN